MADLDITQMTQLLVAPAADDVLYLGDVSEVVLEDQNKHIEVENLFQYLDSGYQGDIVLNTAATLDLSVGTVHLNEAVDLTATATQLNAIAALSGGDFTNFGHTHADAANGGQLTSPLLNEAVALVATATELNQLDDVSVGGNTSGDILTTDDSQTLTNKTLTTPTIGDFTSAGHDHSNAAGGGTLTLSVTIPVFDAAVPVTTGEKGIIVIPPHLNGLELTNVVCGVWDKGITLSTDVGVYRSRGGSEVAMLSTEVTIGDEWYAQDGVINTSNDDVETGDIINVNISGIHSGTAPNGLTVTLEFS